MLSLPILANHILCFWVCVSLMHLSKCNLYLCHPELVLQSIKRYYSDERCDIWHYGLNETTKRARARRYWLLVLSCLQRDNNPTLRFSKNNVGSIYAISTLLIMNNYISGSVVRLYMEHVKVAKRFRLASASRINFKLIHR